MSWYLKAAGQGHTQSQNMLGLMFDQGKGVTKNPTVAAKWYEKAGEGGLALAQFNIATMYELGEGVTQDYVKAAKWYEKSAEQGYGKAQVSLGTLYHQGKGVALLERRAELLDIETPRPARRSIVAPWTHSTGRSCSMRSPGTRARSVAGATAPPLQPAHSSLLTSSSA